MSNKESIELTAQEEQLIELFTTYFIEAILNGAITFSDAVDDVEVDVTEEFLTKLREVLA